MTRPSARPNNKPVISNHSSIIVYNGDNASDIHDS